MQTEKTPKKLRAITRLLVLLSPLLVIASLALVYYHPREQILTINADYKGYYHGLGFHDEPGFFGKNWFYIRVDEDDSWWEVDFRGYGYSPYRGYYPNGNLKEEGVCLVEQNGGVGDPSPDRHQVVEGKYYAPDGKLLSSVANGTGKQILCFPSGTIGWELELLNGRRVEHIMYWPTGEVSSHHLYDSQERADGLYVSNHQDGKPKTRGQYRAGKEVGVWYRFYQDGSIQTIEDFTVDPATKRKFEPGVRMPTAEELKIEKLP